MTANTKHPSFEELDHAQDVLNAARIRYAATHTITDIRDEVARSMANASPLMKSIVSAAMSHDGDDAQHYGEILNTVAHRVETLMTIARVREANLTPAPAGLVEALEREARRVAEVNRAEFYLHNAVFQRDFIAEAHDAAIAHDNILNAREERNRLSAIADGSRYLSGFALSLPNGTLISNLVDYREMVAVRVLRRGSYYETKREAEAMRSSYRPDAVVIPYSMSFESVEDRAAYIAAEAAKKPWQR
ncbi:TPA: hypothetical protein LU109_003572 [Enterobacter hormaechei subsp. xiangfangensis]|nr:hypothetical protein [Enterobacter hormaechei subsp. xiangfangensis]